MAVYKGDNASQVNLALNSIISQTKVPDEFIVVVDGPISQGVEDILIKFSSEKLIKIVWLDDNVGRGQARNAAINFSTGELISIMDSDDIARPDRLEHQFNFMLSRDVDMCGGFIEEFSDEPGDLGVLRKVPLEDRKIRSQLRYRSAFNHVTLTFKRSLYDSVNGYRALNHAEDWDFYLRCASQKVIFANMDLVLVDVKKNISRRGGISNFNEEVIVLLGAYKRGQTTLINLIFQIVFRFVKAVLPMQVRKRLHKIARSMG